jgi:hypothetical protein
MEMFSILGQSQREPDILKRATKSSGPDISFPQAVNDKHAKATFDSVPELALAAVHIQSLAL